MNAILLIVLGGAIGWILGGVAQTRRSKAVSRRHKAATQARERQSRIVRAGDHA